MWPVEIPTVFQTLVTVSLHSPNGRQMPAVSAVQGDCERVYLYQYILSNTWLTLNTVNSAITPCAAYMRQRTGSALVRIMACRLFGAKPLPEPMLLFHQLDPKEKTSVKFETKYGTFHARKCVWNYRLRNGGHVCLGLNVLSSKHINKRAVKELLKNGAAVGITGTILCMRLANERQRYSVWLSLIGWARTPCVHWTS